MIRYTDTAPRPHVLLPPPSDITAWSELTDDLEQAVQNPPFEPMRLLALRGLAEHRLFPVVSAMRYASETGTHDGHSKEEVLRLIDRLLALRIGLMAVCPPNLTFGN